MAKTNFLDTDSSILEKNLKFVKNEVEEELDQIFGSGQSNETAMSAPPRDYIVVTPKPDDPDQLHDSSDSNDTHFVPPISKEKPRRVRKSTAGKRKVQFHWRDGELVRLISAVEKRRGIWDVNSPEYKFPKIKSWREVVNELNITGVDVNEVKTKWWSLRVSFNFNLKKMREKNSGQGASDTSTVVWRHFKQMTFLINKDVRKPKLSPSKIELLPPVNDRSTLDDFPDSPQPTTPQAEVSYRRESGTANVPTPKSPPSSTCSTIAESALNNTTTILHSADLNSTFCDYMLSELQALPEHKARTLRKMLGRAMFNFMDECEGEPQTAENRKS